MNTKRRPNTSRLTLDRSHLVQILEDPAFYQSCPYFAWLQPVAREASTRYRSSGKGCAKCRLDFRHMQPVCDAFFATLKVLDEATRRTVRRYLETKRGRLLGSIIVYYRATRQQPRPLKVEI